MGSAGPVVPRRPRLGILQAASAGARRTGGGSKKERSLSISPRLIRRHCRSSRSAVTAPPQRRETKERNAMTENTVKLHRVLRAPPQRIYRAFLDADAMAKWLPPNGFTGKVQQI